MTAPFPAASLLLFVFGFILILLCSGRLLHCSAYLSQYFGIPDIITGVAVIGIAAALPGIMLTAISSVMGEGEMAVGTALGAIICNTGLVVGTSRIIAVNSPPLKSFNWHILYFFLGIAALAFMGLSTGEFSRFDGFLLIIMLAGYFFLTASLDKKEKAKQSHEESAAPPIKSYLPNNSSKAIKNIFLFLFYAALIFAGCYLMVKYAADIAWSFKIEPKTMGLTALALAAVAPQLFLITRVAAGRRGEAAFSNIIGANIFNIYALIGIASSLSAISISRNALSADLSIAAVFMAVLCVPVLMRARTYRWQGFALFMMYVFYIICAIRFF